jgi:hypothetical protein
MTSTFTEAAVRQCVVCDRTAGSDYSAGGDWMLVYHYAPPDGNRACGHWIHENCRYRDDAPMCPCGIGPAEEGLTRVAVDALHPPPGPGHGRDESVPTADELAAVEAERSFDSEDDADDGAENSSDSDGN